MLHGTPPEKILCLTFTNAAATEMKQRIKEKLALWHESDLAFIESDLSKMGEEVSPEICQKAINLHSMFHKVYDQLKIMTIHALCAEILKRFHSLHSPNVEILEPYEAQNFQLDIIKQTLAEISSDHNLQCYHHYLFLSDYMDIQQIYKTINQLLFELKNKLEVDDISGVIYALHQANARRTPRGMMNDNIKSFKANKDVWQSLYKALRDAEEKSSDDFKDLLEMMENSINPAQQWEEYLNVFLTKERKPRQRLVSKKFSIEHENFFQLLLLEQESAEECWIQYKRQVSAALNDAVVSLALACYQKVAAAKASIGVLTFNDLISQTLNLLHNSPKAPGILYDLDYQIDHVLVDESQDNSDDQWQIIRALTEEFFAGEGARTIDRTIFIVGDMKQSIFSFQGASPELFQQAGEFFADKVVAIDKPWHMLDMQVSFRSNQTVLNLVNAICAANSLHSSHKPVEHIAHRDGQGVIEIWPLIEKEESDQQEGWILPRYDGSNMEIAEQVAAFIADKISAWIVDNRVIAAKGRAVEAGDIMILVRKRGAVVTALRRQLSQRNIKVVECSKSRLKDHIIVQDLMALLSFLTDCDDDLNLACLLKSPLFNVSEKELFTLCHQRQGTVWQQLQNQSLCYKELEEIKKLKQTSTVLQLLMDVLYHRDKIAEFAARFGEETNIVIAAFLETVCEFENKYVGGGYSAFIKWFETMEVELQLNGAAEGNAIRIMTVHAAKGLQAPIVILADAASTEYSPPQRVFWRAGVPITALNAEYDDELLLELKQKNRQQEDFESNRLLYVAITRAEDELYVMGHKVNRLKGSWYDVISSAAADGFEAC